MSSKMVIITIAILPLLLFINTKQTSAQAPAPAKGTSYGLGGYAMEGQDQQVTVPKDARLLKTEDDVKNYTTNDHADKQFKPCRMSSQNINGIFDIFQVFYDEETAIEGCTVDFIFDEIDRISAMIAVADEGLACLEDCGGGNDEWTASSANLVPFTYSRSNEEIKTLHTGPLYNKDQASCKSECTDNGGKCMASPTSLQIALNKCATKVRAWIHLVGEPLSSWSIVQEAEGDSASFDLTIATGNKPTIIIKNLLDGAKFVNEPHGTDGKPVAILNCFTDDKMAMIPELKFWKIKSGNPELNGKHLLVFHLLPQAATRVFNGKGQLQKAPAPGMPKCNGTLAIFNAVGILQSVPPPTTTTQTTETTTSVGTATNETETTDAPSEKNNTLLIVGIVAATVLALIIVAILVYCLCCRNNDSEEDNDEDAETGMGSGDDVENDDEAPE